jgi:enterochelin esterase-like enzyme
VSDAGTIVTETFPFDGGRQVSVHVPPEPPQAVIYAGDGQLISRWGGHLESAGLPPTLVVGAHRTASADEMDRIAEYSPAIDPARFAAHERFFVEDIGRWVRARFGIDFPASRTIVAGVSAGAELALAMGMRHPDRYGTLFAASPGAGYRPPDVMPPPLPRAYLTAGTFEPFFLENATRWADAFTAAGAEVRMTMPVGSHGDPFWQSEFVEMLRWTLAAS